MTIKTFLLYQTGSFVFSHLINHYCNDDADPLIKIVNVFSFKLVWTCECIAYFAIWLQVYLCWVGVHPGMCFSTLLSFASSFKTCLGHTLISPVGFRHYRAFPGPILCHIGFLHLEESWFKLTSFNVVFWNSKNVCCCIGCYWMQPLFVSNFNSLLSFQMSVDAILFWLAALVLMNTAPRLL